MCVCMSYIWAAYPCVLFAKYVCNSSPYLVYVILVFSTTILIVLFICLHVLANNLSWCSYISSNNYEIDANHVVRHEQSKLRLSWRNWCWNNVSILFLSLVIASATWIVFFVCAELCQWHLCYNSCYQGMICCLWVIHACKLTCVWYMCRYHFVWQY